MQVHLALPLEPLLPACALTVGTFDGVHRGHQLLVGRVKQEAAKLGVPSAVLTFQDMPFCYFKPDECPQLLTLLDEKIEAFRALEIDHLFIVPFDKSIAEQSAETFAREVLSHQLGVKTLVCGPDFALGRDRAGDVAALRALGSSCGFEVQALQAKLLEDARPISSTRCRQNIEDGEVAFGARLLGRPFSLRGRVVSGQQLGRTIGFPTINLEPDKRKVVPAHGVYAVRAFFDDEPRSRRAALNIGVRPTVSGIGRSIEFHVLDETIAVPPRSARLEFVQRLRSEQKFAGVEALAAQLKQDISHAADVLN